MNEQNINFNKSTNPVERPKEIKSEDFKDQSDFDVGITKVPKLEAADVILVDNIKSEDFSNMSKCSANQLNKPSANGFDPANASGLYCNTLRGVASIPLKEYDTNRARKTELDIDSIKLLHRLEAGRKERFDDLVAKGCTEEEAHCRTTTKTYQNFKKFLLNNMPKPEPHATKLEVEKPENALHIGIKNKSEDFSNTSESSANLLNKPSGNGFDPANSSGLYCNTLRGVASIPPTKYETIRARKKKLATIKLHHYLEAVRKERFDDLVAKGCTEEDARIYCTTKKKYNEYYKHLQNNMPKPEPHTTKLEVENPENALHIGIKNKVPLSSDQQAMFKRSITDDKISCPGPITSTVFVPNAVATTIEEFLKQLETQNEGLDTSLWNIRKQTIDQNGLLLSIILDAQSAVFLRSIKCKPSLGLRQVKFTNLKGKNFKQIKKWISTNQPDLCVPSTSRIHNDETVRESYFDGDRNTLSESPEHLEQELEQEPQEACRDASTPPEQDDWGHQQAEDWTESQFSGEWNDWLEPDTVIDDEDKDEKPESKPTIVTATHRHAATTGTKSGNGLDAYELFCNALRGESSTLPNEYSTSRVRRKRINHRFEAIKKQRFDDLLAIGCTEEDARKYSEKSQKKYEGFKQFHQRNLSKPKRHVPKLKVELPEIIAIDNEEENPETRATAVTATTRETHTTEQVIKHTFQIGIKNKVPMSTDQQAMVKRSIIEAITEITESGTGPRFRKCVCLDGWIYIVCENKNTRDWIVNLVENYKLKPWPDAELSIIEGRLPCARCMSPAIAPRAVRFCF